MTEKAENEKNSKTLQALIKSKNKDATEYTLSKKYSEKEFISHKEFGMGFVIKVLGKERVEVFFSDKKRKLVQNFKNN